MNILVTLNSGYVYPLTVMLRSLMRTNPGEKFTVYVAHSSLTADDFEKIRSSVDIGRCRVVGIAVDNRLFADASCKSRLSKETYYRLYAAEFLPESVDRILYLDPDIIINGRLRKLYDIDFGTRLFAAAGHNNRFLNSLNRRRLGMPEHSVYTNNGVIMMNISLLRREKSAKMLMKYIAENNKKLLLEDQDVFNALYSGRKIILDPEIVNMDELTFRRLERRTGREEARNFVRNNTVIIHYNGKEKPWNAEYKGKLGGFFRKYEAERNNVCELRQNAV